MLHVDVRKALPSFTLQLRFEQDAGEKLVLFGPSGCGKTTLLRCLAGLERPDAGQIRLNESVFFDAPTEQFLPPRLRRIGYMFQDYALFPHLSVKKNILYGCAFVVFCLLRNSSRWCRRNFNH